MSEKQKTSMLVTVFIGMVGLIVIGYFHFMVGRGKVNTYRRNTTKMVKDMADYEKQLAQIRDLMGQKDEVARQAEAIAKVERRLPSSPDAPGFLNALLVTLSNTGIIQEEVRPDDTADRTLYTEIPYKIKAHGHYHAFGQFLTLLEQNPDRFMRVKKIKLTNNIARPSIHPVEMEIATFMFNKTGQAAIGPEKKTKGAKR